MRGCWCCNIMRGLLSCFDPRFALICWFVMEHEALLNSRENTFSYKFVCSPNTCNIFSIWVHLWVPRQWHTKLYVAQRKHGSVASPMCQKTFNIKIIFVVLVALSVTPRAHDPLVTLVAALCRGGELLEILKEKFYLCTKKDPKVSNEFYNNYTFVLNISNKNYWGILIFLLFLYTYFC